MTWAGLLVGVVVLAVAVLAARPPHQATAALVALVAAATAVLLSGGVVVKLITTTREVAATGATEVGPGPLPHGVVERFRGMLDAEGGTWALVTPQGRCRDDGRAYFWVALQMLPHPADCRSPTYELYWQLPPPEGFREAASGQDYWVVEP